MAWNADKAAEILDEYDNCYFIPPASGKKELKKSHRYHVGSRGARKQIAIARERIDGAITVYVNSKSIAGNEFRNGKLSGLLVTGEYFPGHEGPTGDKGISASVAALETLNPKYNHVYRLEVEGPSSFKDLMNWYRGLRNFQDIWVAKDDFIPVTTSSSDELKNTFGGSLASNDNKISEKNTGRSIDTQPAAGILEVNANSVDLDGDSDINNAESAEAGEDQLATGGLDSYPKPNLDEIKKQIDEECANLEGTDVDVVAKRRVGQGVFRDRLLAEFGGACCMTGLKNIRLLIASHIVPWSQSEPAQKLARENGLLLSVSMDALFDKGLISFADNGSILIGNNLDAETIEILGLKTEFALPKNLLDARKENLAKHRKLHGFGASL